MNSVKKLILEDLSVFVYIHTKEQIKFFDPAWIQIPDPIREQVWEQLHFQIREQVWLNEQH